MGLFRKITREKFEEKLRKDDSCRSFQMYEHGRDIETFEGTKEELEKKLGKPVRLILSNENGFVDHIYERYEFIGRLDPTYLVEYQAKHDKKNRLVHDTERNQIYKGKPVRVK